MMADCTRRSSVRLEAERTGFEPAVGFDPYTGLANRRFRPLSHLSWRTRHKSNLRGAGHLPSRIMILQHLAPARKAGRLTRRLPWRMIDSQGRERLLLGPGFFVFGANWRLISWRFSACSRFAPPSVG